jgi:hypothetical protein
MRNLIGSYPGISLYEVSIAGSNVVSYVVEYARPKAAVVFQSLTAAELFIAGEKAD